MSDTDKARIKELEGKVDAYERLLDALGSARYAFDFSNGKFSWISPAIEDLTGRPRTPEGSWEGWDITKSVQLLGDLADLELNEAGRLNRTGELEEWHSIVEIALSDGASRWLRDTSVIVRNDDGIVTGTIGLFRDATRRIKAEANLAASEARFRAMVDRCPLGFHVHKINDEGVLVFDSFNPSAQAMLPMDLTALIGLPTIEAFPSVEEHGVFERYKEIALQGGTHAWDQVGYTNEGSSYAYQVFAFQIMQGSTAVLFLDTSEKERSRRAILESEARFRDLVNSMEEALFMADSQGALTFASPAFLKQTGAEMGEVSGHMLVEFVAPEYRMLVQRTLDSALAESSTSTEFKLLTADGERRWMRLACHKVEHQGQLIGISGLIQDIHEQRLAEAAILASEERLKALLESSSDVVAIVDAFGQITYVNQAVAGVLGYDASLFEGTSIHVYCPPDELAAMRDLLGQASRSHGWQGTRLIHLHHAEGRYVPLNCRFRSMVDHPGIQGVVMTLVKADQDGVMAKAG